MYLQKSFCGRYKSCLSHIEEGKGYIYIQIDDTNMACDYITNNLQNRNPIKKATQIFALAHEMSRWQLKCYLHACF